MIADRLANPSTVAAAVRSAEQASQYPFGWGGASLHCGPAGSALLFRYLSRVDGAQAQRWAGLAHDEIVRAAQNTAAEPLPHAGLAAGTAGMALALADSFRDDHRYAAAARSVTDRLTEQVLAAPPWPDPGAGLWDGHYDVITGATGTIAGLLAILEVWDEVGPDGGLVEESADRARAALHRLAEDLVRMCTPDAERQVTPWSLDPRHYPAPEYLDEYPQGYINLGLAHGLPGVLSALSLALAARPADLPAERVQEAITRLVAIIESSRADDDHGPNWPAGRAVDSHGRPLPVGEGPARTAWCYGAPGVSLSFLHASRALDDTALAARAAAGFGAVMSRVQEYGRFPSGTVCHGAAGILLIATAFARAQNLGGGADAVRVQSDRWIDLLIRSVTDHVDEGHTLGVQDLEQEVWLDSPALLGGAAGVAAVLLSATRAGDDRALGKALLAW
jgi:lantibiotic biosynthesis protein